MEAYTLSFTTILRTNVAKRIIEAARITNNNRLYDDPMIPRFFFGTFILAFPKLGTISSVTFYSQMSIKMDLSPQQIEEALICWVIHFER